jgi:tRNA A64-2'-O-ribosylphosphate transferase
MLGSMIITDSTRAGKRFPDALSKTVPLWCAVINKAIELKIRQNDSSKNIEWDKWDEYGSLFTPPTSVGQSEHDQMANLVPHFAEKLLVCS